MAGSSKVKLRNASISAFDVWFWQIATAFADASDNIDIDPFFLFAGVMC
jgi:hypothetical protein